MKIRFNDSHGRSLKLSEHLTIEDLARHGLAVTPHSPGTPLPEDWYTHADHGEASLKDPPGGSPQKDKPEKPSQAKAEDVKNNQ